MQMQLKEGKCYGLLTTGGRPLDVRVSRAGADTIEVETLAQSGEVITGQVRVDAVTCAIDLPDDWLETQKAHFEEHKRLEDEARREWETRMENGEGMEVRVETAQEPGANN
jgi:hypothetical protein